MGEQGPVRKWVKGYSVSSGHTRAFWVPCSKHAMTLYGVVFRPSYFGGKLKRNDYESEEMGLEGGEDRGNTATGSVETPPTFLSGF